MATNRRLLGNRGEAIAAAYLEQQGYTIVARQWRCALGEIDLVARDGDMLVFVEVRTRRTTDYGTPEESLTPRKQQRLRDLAFFFLETMPFSVTIGWRIDLIAVDLRGSTEVRHIQYAVGDG